MALHVLGPGAGLARLTARNREEDEQARLQREEAERQRELASTPEGLNQIGDRILDRLLAMLDEPTPEPEQPRRLGLPTRIAGGIALGFGDDPATKRLVLSEIARRSPEAAAGREQEFRQGEIQRTLAQLNLVRTEQKRRFDIETARKADLIRNRKLEIDEILLERQLAEIDAEIQKAKESEESRVQFIQDNLNFLPNLAPNVAAAVSVERERGDPASQARAQSLNGAFVEYESLLDRLSQEDRPPLDEEMDRLAGLRGTLDILTAKSISPEKVRTIPNTFQTILNETRAGLDAVAEIEKFLDEHPNIGLSVTTIAAKVLGGNVLTQEESDFAALLEGTTAPIRKALIGTAQSEQELASIENFLPRLGMTRSRIKSALNGAKFKVNGQRKSTLDGLELQGFEVGGERVFDQMRLQKNKRSAAIGIPPSIPEGAPEGTSFLLSQEGKNFFRQPDGKIIVQESE